jgi:hypothetical protein
VNPKRTKNKFTFEIVAAALGFEFRVFRRNQLDKLTAVKHFVFRDSSVACGSLKMTVFEIISVN